MDETIKEFRVRDVELDGEPYFYIEQRYLWGLVWAEIDIAKRTNDKSLIEGRLKELDSQHICIIDRGNLDK